MCILFYSQLWDWDGRMGGLGRAAHSLTGTEGSRQGNSLHPLCICFPSLVTSWKKKDKLLFHN